MAKCTFNELREKEVINLCDGRRLGFVCDLELSLCDGCITAILVPGEGSLFGFGRCEAIVIAWDKIETIGSDAILVRVQPGECCPHGEHGDHEKKRRKSSWFG